MSNRAGNKIDTLCWTCKKSTNMYECIWAIGVPRDDWNAEATEIYCNGLVISSFFVKSCPAYEKSADRKIHYKRKRKSK